MMTKNLVIYALLLLGVAICHGQKEICVSLLAGQISSNKSLVGADVDHANCWRTCAEVNTALFYALSNVTCACSNAFGRQWEDGACDTPCAGNANETCGQSDGPKYTLRRLDCAPENGRSTEDLCKAKCTVACQQNEFCRPQEGTCELEATACSEAVGNERKWGPSCLNNCHCRDISESCNFTTGFCQSGCAAGHKLTQPGNNCQAECEQLEFGPDCSSVCRCHSDDTCSPTDGTCTTSSNSDATRCATGYQNPPQCNQSCTSGKYGTQCSGTCHCAPGVVCDVVDGECKGSTSCAAGWKNAPHCQDECIIGQKYGPNCQQTCHCAPGDLCNTETGMCTTGTVAATTCAAGWKTAPNCNTVCGEKEYGAGCLMDCHCASGDSCNDITGSCTSISGQTATTCAAGWKTAPDCNQECIIGQKYGPNCLQTCHCAPGDLCNTKTGMCTNGTVAATTCAAGWKTAPNCNTECTIGQKYGPNCQQTCHCAPGDLCNTETGMCTNGTVAATTCAAGWKTAPNCNTVCGQNKYGSGCLMDCHCASGDSCNHITGSCTSTSGQTATTCAAGWKTAPDCNQVCGENKYGAGCSMDCHCASTDSCNHITGSCTSGGQDATTCAAGWKTAPDCNQGCENGEFGPNCKQSCHCLADHACDVNGTCKNGSVDATSCAPGWKIAPLCFQPCVNNSEFGENCAGVCHCAASTNCDAQTGKCTTTSNVDATTCSDGYLEPPMCQAICGKDKYGAGCSMECHCASNDSCNHITGSCTSGGLDATRCAAGWKTAPDCNQVCGQDEYGAGCLMDCHCASGDSCNDITGSCTSISGQNATTCAAGWKAAPNCNQACESGTYGENCNKSCHCADSDTCDVVTGNCLNADKAPASTCAPGWKTAPDCKDKCNTNAEFGANCAGTCHCHPDDKCDSLVGKCTDAAGTDAGRCEPKYFNPPLCDRDCLNDRKFGEQCNNDCHCAEGDDCDPSNGRCTSGGADSSTCAAGYVNAPHCNTSCEDKDMFGANCESECACVEGDTCQPETGKCSTPGGKDSTVCRDGHTNSPYCNQTCDVNVKFGRNCANTCHCDVGDTCSPVNGTCWTNGGTTEATSCGSGYKGAPLCSTACSQNVEFGRNCAGRCHCAPADSCDAISGVCRADAASNATTCGAGFTEPPACQTGCSAGDFGANCSRKCGCASGHACNSTDGSCTDAAGADADLCAPGTENAPLCDRLCNGTFGPNCNKTCHCATADECDPISGKCGNEATSECAIGWFALPDCQQNCKGVCREGTNCNVVSGECEGGCSSSHRPPECHHQFEGTGQCYRVNTRTLVPKPGAADTDSCRKLCIIEGTYHYALTQGQTCYCIDSFQEKLADGRCDAKCGTKSCGSSDGLFFNVYQTVCEYGKWGHQGNNYCVNNCTCTDSQFCNPTDGRCSSLNPACSVGSWGRNCRNRCNCRSSPPTQLDVCDRETGHCLFGGCADGFRTTDLSTNCQAECENGTFGEGCAFRCRCHPDDVCDHVTGYCRRTTFDPANNTKLEDAQRCLAGYHSPPLCNLPCGGCNETCDSTSGACDACEAGFVGNLCRRSATSGGTTFNPVRGENTTAEYSAPFAGSSKAPMILFCVLAALLACTALALVVRKALKH